MRRVALLVLLVLLLACGCGDRLKPGDTAMVRCRKGTTTYLDDRGVDNRPPTYGLPQAVRTGDIVRVVADPAPLSTTDGPMRPVQVMVKEGESAGRIGSLGRDELHPLR